jgi:hypothetical protein
MTAEVNPFLNIVRLKGVIESMSQGVGEAILQDGDMNRGVSKRNISTREGHWNFEKLTNTALDDVIDNYVTELAADKIHFRHLHSDVHSALLWQISKAFSQSWIRSSTSSP